MIHLRTERLIVRDIEETDVEGIFALDSDPEVLRFIGTPVMKLLSEAEHVIANIRAQHKENGIGRWAMEERASGEFIGWTGLKLEKNIRPFHYYDIGYRLILFYNITCVTAAGLMGLALLVREVLGRNGLRRTIELWWFVVSLVLFGYAYLVGALDAHFDILLPGTAPSFHYFFYMKAAMVLFAGTLVARLARRLPFAPAHARMAAMLFWVVPIAIVYPGYSGRMDVHGMRAQSLAISEDNDLVDMFRYLRDSLVWDDVVLCDDSLSVFPLMPSARKVVATMCTMADPYVDLVPRLAERDSMLEGLKAEGPDEEVLLEKYGVTHLLLRTTDEAGMPLREKWFPSVVLRNEGYVLFAR